MSDTTTATPNVADVEEAMRDVVDPELGINVVDLGLVYGITVDAQKHAVLDMTLTSAACPLTDVIEDQTQQALEGLVASYRVNWVWMPPWGPDKITDDGREQLRALGCSISTASTSVLADEVIGRSVREAMTTHEAMRRMLTSKGEDAGDEDVIGDGVAFAGVAKYPARVKCALLGWMAFTDALHQAGIDTSSTAGASATAGTSTTKEEAR